jgi:hypothetical protein
MALRPSKIWPSVAPARDRSPCAEAKEWRPSVPFSRLGRPVFERAFSGVDDDRVADPEGLADQAAVLEAGL